MTSTPARRMNLLPRVLSAVVLLAVVIAAVLVGGLAVDALIAVAALLAAYEIVGVLRHIDGLRPQLWLIGVVAVWMSLRFVLPDPWGSTELILLVAVGGGLVAGLFTRTPWESWSASAAAGIYLGFGLGSFLALDRYRSGDARFDLALVGVVVGGVIACDVFAYFVGFAVGRHPFFPAISPSKTVEGAMGGLVGAVTVATAAGIPVLGLSPLVAIGLGALIAVAAQAGDLVESALKRQAGVKDSSALIPGHGGSLDRLDSLLLVGPAVYVYLRLTGLA